MSSNLAQITKIGGDLAPSRPMGLTPQNIDEALRLAEIMAKASIIPKDYQGNPGNILVGIQWGAELGLPPLQALQSIAVINGRPAMWGDAVIALVRGSGLLESMHEDIGDTSATCTVKRRGEEAESRTFSLEDAKKAGLLGKQGPWSQYQKRMLQMRARAWALRDVFPDVLRGVHVAEEAQDIPAERSMGPAEVVPMPSASRTADVKAKLAARQPARTPEPDPEPGPELVTVLRMIAKAFTRDELKASVDAAKLLPPVDQKLAREAYKVRVAEIKAQQEAEAAAMAEPPPETQTVAEWQQEFMGGAAHG